MPTFTRAVKLADLPEDDQANIREMVRKKYFRLDERYDQLPVDEKGFVYRPDGKKVIAWLR